VEKTTRFFRPEHVTKQWHLVDAGGKTLGRLSTEIARLLRGKHKPQFTPNADVGDFVIVINAAKVRLTGPRADLKKYFHHSGYPGGAAYESVKDVMRTNPQRVIEHAVRGMLPHNRLGRRVFKKLKVYPGAEHPHSAQRPAPYTAV
jgi:large subunit ribosomal protein L13